MDEARQAGYVKPRVNERASTKSGAPRRARGACARAIGALSIGACVALLAGACSRRPANATPEGATRELVERMMRVQGTPDDAKAVYDLLSKRAQQNLGERSERYTNASGKKIAPEAMIVPSRFLLRFEPQQYTARIVGAHALVEVKGLAPAETALIPCVFEDDAWRVDVELPPLPVVRMRPGTEL